MRLMEEGFMRLSPRGYARVGHAASFTARFAALSRLAKEQERHRFALGVVLLEQQLLDLMDAASGNATRSDSGDLDDDAGAATTGSRRDRGADAHPGVADLALAIRRDPRAPVDFAAETEALHLSTPHFRRLFRAHTGMPPLEYLLHCRMQAAAQALHDPRRQIKAIAAAYGYDDPAQFSKLFKVRLGLSPLQYRRSLPLGHPDDDLQEGGDGG